MDVITTIGPRSWSEDVVGGHLKLGVHCIRFPFAKETPEEHAVRAGFVREMADALGKRVHLMADVPGGKPRLDNASPVTVTSRNYRIGLTENADVDFSVTAAIGGWSPVPGSMVAIGDGENTFRVVDVSPSCIEGVFTRPGVLERRRAFLPLGIDFVVPCFTPDDRRYCATAHDAGFDWVALSFVCSASDVERARQWCLDELNWKPHIVAKIETLSGVSRIREIAEVSDSVMVARGDLGVHLGFERLWHAQQQVTAECVRQERYVIAATGFLETMAAKPWFSRAEAIDVITALSMGANAIMFSAETTIGEHPLEVVQAVKSIAAEYYRGKDGATL